MADMQRGFHTADALTLNQATHVDPAYMKRKYQLSRDEAITTRNIANVRIHVIGSVCQKFQILAGPLPMHYVMKKDNQNLTTIGKIAVVCGTLKNYMPISDKL